MPHSPGGGAHGTGHGDQPVSRIAVAALVVAVANLVFGSFLGLFFPVIPALWALLAVGLGHLALARIRSSGAAGRGFALTALATGYLWLVVTAVIVGWMLLFTGYGFALLGF